MKVVQALLEGQGLAGSMVASPPEEGHLGGLLTGNPHSVVTIWAEMALEEDLNGLGEAREEMVPRSTGQMGAPSEEDLQRVGLEDEEGLSWTLPSLPTGTSGVVMSPHPEEALLLEEENSTVEIAMGLVDGLNLGTTSSHLLKLQSHWRRQMKTGPMILRSLSAPKILLTMGSLLRVN